MPIYDYGCHECETVFEKFMPISKRLDPVNSPCPNCGKENCVHIMIGAPAVHYSFMSSSSVQASKKTPEAFKDKLREIKKEIGPAAKGIEL